MIAKRFSIRLGACSAAALLASVTLFAQNPGGAPGSPQPMPQQQPSQPSMPSQGTEAGPPSSAQSMADQAFVADAMQGNMGEVQLAQLAEQKSQSADVKQFAKKLASEHQQMNDKWFQPVAQQIGASTPKKPSKKDKKLMEKLQGLSGSAFDQQYITAMVQDHQKDLKKFKEESESAQNPNVKQIAQQGEKVISQHLQIAEQVAKNHNIPVEGGKEVSSR